MAHYNDMREFLEELKKRGDLMVIDKKVSPVHEICAFTRKASDMGGPALLFTNVEGYDMPVLSGLYGTRERVRLALGLGDDTKSVIKEYVAHENKFIPPVTVGDDEAPVHEVVLTGDAVDLYKLPILTNFEKDLGPYITAGVQMANDPITGVRNSSMHRMLLLDKNHMTCFAPKGRHLGTIIERNEDSGKGTEIATVIGGDPIIAIASQCRPALGTDEMGMAGGLRGEAVKMVKCKTIDVRDHNEQRQQHTDDLHQHHKAHNNSQHDVHMDHSGALPVDGLLFLTGFFFKHRFDDQRHRQQRQRTGQNAGPHRGVFLRRRSNGITTGFIKDISG